jgi:hypothetical protein
MFGKRRNKNIIPAHGATPVQGTMLAASTEASIDPRALILVHSRGQGSTPAHKALLAHALANPPARTNSVLAHGLASRGIVGFAHASAPITHAIASPAPSLADPAKGDIAWDSTGPR